jgi:hypothetical protein
MRIPTNYIVLLRGRPILLLELGGERLTGLPDLPASTLKRALQLAIDHLSGQGQVTVKEWNGSPIIDSPTVPILEEMGFYRDALIYVHD